MRKALFFSLFLLFGCSAQYGPTPDPIVLPNVQCTGDLDQDGVVTPQEAAAVTYLMGHPDTDEIITIGNVQYSKSRVLAVSDSSYNGTIEPLDLFFVIDNQINGFCKNTIKVK